MNVNSTHFEGGCGAFGGYHDLKAVIQLLAAGILTSFHFTLSTFQAEVGCSIAYYTFGVKGLGPSLLELHSILKEKKATVGKFHSFCLKVLFKSITCF